MVKFTQKRFSNKICKECIKQNFIKYGKFDVQCDGITIEDDVKLAISEGFDEHTARWMYDPVYFFEKIYGKPARWYQPRILCCTARNMVGRQCRQTGKTLMFMYKIFHFVLTNSDKTVLVVTPQEAQIKKIWDEYIFRDFVYKNALVKESVTGKTMSPYYQITFDNGSKIIMMIAGPGVRGQSGDWIYIDEAAIVPNEVLNDILMSIASRAEEATILMTSTPKGRGNAFFEACNTNSEFNEYHISIDQVDEMKSQIPRFRKMLGATGFIQECMADFPDTSGGPFNYKGIDAAQKEYEYEDCVRQEGWIYFGGVDWNGPNIGTYFYIVAFNPDNLLIKVVDKQVVASAEWNATVAKNEFIRLNRKWKPKNWKTDFGYGHGVNEELRYWSTYKLESNIGPNHPDAMVKHILEPVEFGSWMEIEDPFTKEEVKKTTKSFVISQVSRLFEVENDAVPICYSKSDVELTKSLENYKLLSISDKGVEKYGFDKKAGIEDHALDSLFLAIYGIIKNYNELFKQIFYFSVPLDGVDLLTPRKDTDYGKIIPHGSSVVLITGNDSTPIELDEKAFEKYNNESEAKGSVFIARTFNKSMEPSRGRLGDVMKRRNSQIVNRRLDF